MAILNDEHKIFIVQALACYDTPSQVVLSVKEEFKIDVTRQQVEGYDYTKQSGKKVSKQWRAIFDATRLEYEKETAKVPVSSRSIRLRRLQRYINNAEKSGNFVLAAQLLEQVAKECGGIYENRRIHVHSGPDGKPITTETTHKFEKMTDAEIDARINELKNKTGV